MTTRSPREGEVDGQDYFFVTEERFLQAIENNELLEHARFVGNYYGTPKAYVEKLREEGKNVFLEIEVEGAKKVLDEYKDDKGVLSIFLLPPSLRELEKRIRGRRSEPEDIIQERLGKAKREMGLKRNYQFNVLNDNINKSSQEIVRLIDLKIKANQIED